MAHIVPISINIKTLAALIALTITTVLTANFVDLGNYNLVLAMFIGRIKAGIVFAWFMHLKYEGMMNRVIALCGLAFLFLFVGFAYIDLFFR